MRARHLHATLLDRASVPFLKMLSLWLFRWEDFLCVWVCLKLWLACCVVLCFVVCLFVSVLCVSVLCVMCCVVWCDVCEHMLFYVSVCTSVFVCSFATVLVRVYVCGHMWVTTRMHLYLYICVLLRAHTNLIKPKASLRTFHPFSFNLNNLHLTYSIYWISCVCVWCHAVGVSSKIRIRSSWYSKMFQFQRFGLIWLLAHSKSLKYILTHFLFIHLIELWWW